MKSKLLIPIFLFAAGIAAAQNSNLTSLLQQGLLEEQANGNLDAAISDYRSLAGEFDKSRQVAATAVFRLGECYRAQGKTNEAVAQYRRVLSEFSDQPTLVTLSRQNLVGLGAPPAEATASAAAPGAGSGAAETLQNQFALLKAQLAMARGESNNQLIAELFSHDGPEFAQRLRQTIYVSLQNPADQQIAQSLKDARQQLLDYEEMRLKILQAAIAQAGPVHSSPAPTGSEPVAEENDEDQVIRGIQRMIQDSPDLINAGQLGDAANRGQLRVARFLLDHGADVNAQYNGTLALNMAVMRAQKAMVELLLSRGADVNAHDNQGVGGYTALMMATGHGFQAVVEVLLAHGADVNEISDTTTPLHRAVDRGFVNLVKVLLAAGANPNVQDAGGVTPLSYAARAGSIEILKLLLAAKADPDGGRLNAPLLSAIEGLHNDAAELLLESGANPNAMGTVNTDVTVSERQYTGAPVEVTPLFLAAAKGELPMVRLLLKYKADPNDSRTEKRPLLFAALSNTNILDALLGAGANTEVLGWSGQMPARSDFSAFNMRMLERPGPLQYQWTPGGTESANNQTALETSAGQNNPDAVEILLKHSANPNANTPGDETPLLWAAFRPADEKVFKLLLDAGADPNVRDRSGRTPLERVKEKMRQAQISGQVSDFSAVIDLLHAYGALDNVPNWDNIQMVPASGSAETVFVKSTNDWNHFTLLEAILDYFTTAGYTYSSADVHRPLPESYVQAHPFPGSVPLPFPRIRETAMPFPDLTRVVIVRPHRGSTNLTRIEVNLLNTTKDIDCSKDVPLEFGDMVELAQCDHPLSATSWWLSDGQVSTIINYLHGTAQLIVRGQKTPLPLDPWGNRSYIGPVLNQPAAREVLLASSDLSRVKVTRHNPKTGKVSEWTLDCNNPHNPDQPDLLLRDGDVLEVPEK